MFAQCRTWPSGHGFLRDTESGRHELSAGAGLLLRCAADGGAAGAAAGAVGVLPKLLVLLV